MTGAARSSTFERRIIWTRLTAYSILSEKENPDLVQAVRGLCGGFAWSGGPCGALSGGVCFLSLLARELDAEERIKLIGEYHEWFKARTAQYGGENCENIERGDPQNMLTICPGVIMDSYEKCVELLEDRGLA